MLGYVCCCFDTLGIYGIVVHMEIELLRHQEQLIRLPFEHKEIRHFFLVGGYGCVPRFVSVDTGGGEFKYIDELGIGEDVVSVGNGLRYGVVEDVFEVGEKDCYKIIYSSGELTCSKSHELFMRVNGVYKWLEADRLYTAWRLGSDIWLCTKKGESKLLAMAEAGRYECMDITVSESHNYFCCDKGEGVLSHNCGKSFSAVMLIMQLAYRYPRLKAGAMFGLRA